MKAEGLTLLRALLKAWAVSDGMVLPEASDSTSKKVVQFDLQGRFQLVEQKQADVLETEHSLPGKIRGPSPMLVDEFGRIEQTGYLMYYVLANFQIPRQRRVVIEVNIFSWWPPNALVSLTVIIWYLWRNVLGCWH
jgi:hypothetical protein